MRALTFPDAHRRIAAQPNAPLTRPDVSAHDIYLSHRDLIERALTLVCRRQRLSGSDGEDFCSTFRLHLMEDDYAVIRAFQGRSSLQTYLVTVITHFFQDWRNARWGKWRPSAEAKRLGPLAVQLETLIARDRLTMDEACEVLRLQHGATEPRAALEQIAARLPARTGRTFVGDEALETHAAPDERADRTLENREAAAVAERAAGALAQALQSLPAQDRLILKLRFADGQRVVEIARLLRVDQKALYRRIERMLLQLRECLERASISGALLLQAMDERGFDLRLGEAEVETAADVRPFDRSAASPVSPGRPS